LTPETIRYLNQLNRAFYAQVADEFDQTRAGAWRGWERLVLFLPSPPISVLDVGCGNGRFGTFLAKHIEGQIHYHGVDNSIVFLEKAKMALANIPSLQATLEERDIIDQPLTMGEYDLVAAFGVIHHIPGGDNRRTFVRQLAERISTNGLLVYAEWRFYEFERFQARTVPPPEGISLEAGDYLINWGNSVAQQNDPLRYYHYVDDAESVELIAATGLELIATYRADGRTGNMNNYIILKKRRV
jgi:SAM-dependent methyltransferase